MLKFFQLTTQVARFADGVHGCVEHLAQDSPLDITGMQTKADDAPRELFQDDEHRVAISPWSLSPRWSMLTLCWAGKVAHRRRSRRRMVSSFTV